jgi:hypothetical protein
MNICYSSSETSATFLDLKLNINLLATFKLIISLIIQTLHYKDYRKGKRLTYLRLFDMMSGSLPLKRIGLEDENDTKKLLSHQRIWTKFIIILSNFLWPLLAFALFAVIYYKNCSSIDFLTFGIVYTFFYSLISYYVYTINLWQIYTLFTLISYLKLKVNKFNEILKSQINRRRNKINI